MELELYSTIEYTPGWYYTKYPKFYNIDCYKILSDYSHNPDRYTGENNEPVDGVEETKDSCMDLGDIEVEVTNEIEDYRKRKRLSSK